MQGNYDRALSYAVAMTLLIVYGCYLVFQLRSYTQSYNVRSQMASKKVAIHPCENAVRQTEGHVEGPGAHHADQTEEPRLSQTVAIMTLAVSTALVAVCSQSMVSRIEDVTSNGILSKLFLGIVLLPIAGNAAEHATAVLVAIKGKMDLSTSVALGSSIQIAFFGLPVLVGIDWALGNACMTLYFDPFLVAILVVAIVLVNSVISDGKCSECSWDVRCCAPLTLGRLA
jgi:Ca2+:H+ antiporter